MNNYGPDNTVPWSPGFCVAPIAAGVCGQGTQIAGTKTLRPGGGIAIGEGGFCCLNYTVIDAGPHGTTILGHQVPLTATAGVAAIPAVLLAIAAFL